MASTLSELHPQPQSRKWWRPFAKTSNAFDPSASHPFPSLAHHHHHQSAMRSSFLKGRQHSAANSAPPTIFGARLDYSLELASVAISMIGTDKKAYIYGYIPVVVAKCGLFLKENGTDVQGIFRISGSTKRMRELQTIFDEPPNYGKDLDWKTTNPLNYSSSTTSGSTGSLTLNDTAPVQKSYFSVHDAANVLRRYLMSLPEPLIPYTMYEDFRNVLTHHRKDKHKQVRLFKSLISTLPSSSQYLLLYLLDLLSVFALKSEVNLMTSANLAVVFQPGLCSPPPRSKAQMNRIINHQPSKGSSQPSSIQQDSLDEQSSIMREVKEAQEVLQFLIDNQNYFVLGLRPPPKSPGTPHPNQQSAHRIDQPSPGPSSPSSHTLHAQMSHPNLCTGTGTSGLRKLSFKRNRKPKPTDSSSDDQQSLASPPPLAIEVPASSKLIISNDESESPIQLAFDRLAIHQVPPSVKRSKTLPVGNSRILGSPLMDMDQMVGTPVPSGGSSPIAGDPELIAS